MEYCFSTYSCRMHLILLSFVPLCKSKASLCLFLASSSKCHHDDRFPHISLPFSWLLVDTCSISSWCCAVGDKNPPPPAGLKSPCWVEATAASSLTKAISRTGRVGDQARAHLAASRRSVAGGEPSSFLYSTHQPPLWLGWLCSARREVSLIRPHDSWPKQEETSESGRRGT